MTVHTVHIGPLRDEDLARCAELERELFAGDDPWRAGAFAAELVAGHHYRAARTGDGTLVGYAGIALLVRPPQAEAEVHTIGVDPRFQRAGIGRLLLRALLAKADEWGAITYLEVRTDNAAAIALYTSEGFEVLGVRRRYYQPSGANAYTMRRFVGVSGARAGVSGVSTAGTPDTAVVVPDTAAGVPDTAVVVPDTAARAPDMAAVLPDTAAGTPDTAARAADTP